tara:strand:+ start:1889 stop:2065 length:177 start_codon:yes stop_codon:yes gene_type:complete
MPKDVNFNHVNQLMKEINTHTDEIYESLADQDYLQLDKSVGELIGLLKHTQLTVQDEI